MKFNLTIIQHCHEDIDGMIPTEKGRFCAVCTKTVVDFRQMSDEQIAKTHHNSGEQICGIYNNQQVTIQPTKTCIQSSIKQVKWLALGFGFLGLFAPIDGNTKVLSTQIPIEQVRQIPNLFFTEQDSIVPNEKIIIYGNVRDKQLQENLISCNVHIKGTTTTIGTTTDLDGNYKIDATNFLKDTNQITLVYSYIGFDTVEKDYIKGDVLEMNIELVESEPLEDVIVIGYGIYRNPEPTKKNFKEKLKGFFKRDK